MSTLHPLAIASTVLVACSLPLWADPSGALHPPQAKLYVSPSAGYLTTQPSLMMSIHLYGGATSEVQITVNSIPVAPTNGMYRCTAALEPGTNTFAVLASTAAGPIASQDVWYVRVAAYGRDTNAPTLTVTAPDDGLVTPEASVRVAGTASDDSGFVGVFVRGAYAGGEAFEADVPVWIGTNTIDIFAVDPCGNRTHVRRAVVRFIPPPVDVAPPVIVNIGPKSGYVSRQEAVRMWMSVTDDVGVASVTVNGDAAAYSGSWVYTALLAHGTNTFDVVATDKSGKTAAQSVWYLRYTPPPRDTNAPVLTVSAPEDLLVTSNTSCLVAGTAVDDSGIALVYANGRFLGTNDFAGTQQLYIGTNTIAIHARDLAGNMAKDIRRAIRVYVPEPDVTPPTVRVHPESGHATMMPTVLMRISAWDNRGIAGVTVNGAAAVQSNALWLYTAVLAPVSNIFEVIAADTSGNNATQSVLYLYFNLPLRETNPPVLNVTAPADWLETPDRMVRVQGTASDDSGPVTVYINGVAAGTFAFDREMPLRTGTNIFSIIARDVFGNRAREVRRVICAYDGQPTLAILATDLPQAILGRYYKAVLAATGAVGQVRWRITDGALSTGLVFMANGYIYGAPREAGSFPFTVEASDWCQTASASFVLAVVPAPTNPHIARTFCVDGAKSAPYSAALALGGISDASAWTFRALDPLPPGMALRQDGMLEGTPSVPGDYTITMAADGPEGTARGAVSLRVADRAQDELADVTVRSLRARCGRKNWMTVVLTFTAPLDAGPGAGPWAVSVGNASVTFTPRAQRGGAGASCFCTPAACEDGASACGCAYQATDGTVRLAVTMSGVQLARALGVDRDGGTAPAALPIEINVNGRIGHGSAAVRAVARPGRSVRLKTVAR